MKATELLDLIGFSRQPVDLREPLISTIGGFLGIFGILVTAQWLLDPDTAVLIVPSMGASAVLLFASPHAPFAQPWNLVAGHAISAVIGVACWQWIPDYTIAASSSVGLAIGAMYVARCIHPPGGATALAAVIGSERLHQLGYGYEFTPILLNVAAIFAVAVAFNWWFRWRRYPGHLQRHPTPPEPYPPIRHEDFVYALSQIETYVDISEEDLLEIYRLATGHRQQQEARKSD
ncbi:MAG: hypothetical protein D6720_07870 [Gammaproteobacteria bacterium]|nr:MAG: hypothetical protein D6720_07870 [Gammaproteobacteria bacterium]